MPSLPTDHSQSLTPTDHGHYLPPTDHGQYLPTNDHGQPSTTTGKVMDLDAEENSEETTLKPLEVSDIIVGRADWVSPYEEGYHSHQRGQGLVERVTERISTQSTTKEPVVWPFASFQTFMHTPSIAHLPLENHEVALGPASPGHHHVQPSVLLPLEVTNNQREEEDPHREETPGSQLVEVFFAKMHLPLILKTHTF